MRYIFDRLDGFVLISNLVFFLFLGKGFQSVLHQTVYHWIFTVLMYKLESFNPYPTNVENRVSS